MSFDTIIVGNVDQNYIELTKVSERFFPPNKSSRPLSVKCRGSLKSRERHLTQQESVTAVHVNMKIEFTFNWVEY